MAKNNTTTTRTTTILGIGVPFYTCGLENKGGAE